MTAIWRLALKINENNSFRSQCRLILKSLRNALSVKARIRFSIFKGEGQKHFELNVFNKFDQICWKFHLEATTVHNLVQRSIFGHLLDDDDGLTICLVIDIPVEDSDGQLNTTTSDDLDNLLMDDHHSDMVLSVGEQKFRFIVRSWRQGHPSFEPCSHPTCRNRWPKKS